MKHRIFGISLAIILGINTICNAQDTLPQWQEGYLDIHCIASGQGESHFYVMPDGTTMLVDAGDVGDTWTNNHWPDSTKGAGEWIAEYVKHFTPHRRLADNGKTQVDYFLLTHFHSDHMGNMWNPESGIIAAGKTLHFNKIVDRDHPSYDFPSRKKLEDKVIAFPYADWVKACVKDGSKAERFDIGSRRQFALRHGGKYDFEIYNIAASGRCHTGKGKGSVPMWPDGFPIAAYDENVMSCVYTMRYGPFKYYNGGDLGGGNFSLKTMLPRNFEQKVAPLVGNVTAMVLNHHGCMDSTCPEFLWALSPDVIIVPCAEKNHPYTDTFDRIMNPSNPGRRDMYITAEVSRPELGEARWARIKPFGHIVIRVYDKGEKYRVYVLDPLSYDYKVKYVSEEYASARSDEEKSKPVLRRSFEELPLGSIKPDGWLRETLVRQKDGITSDLDKTYPAVCGPRNGWLGGDGDQWERGPYWIDGLLPLAYILDDKELQKKAQAWVEWTLASQDDSGFFGPSTDYPREKGLQRNRARDWWPRMVMLKVLMQYYNAVRDERVLTFMDRYFRYQLKTLPTQPLDKWTPWAAYRHADNMIAAQWLYGKTGEKYLLDLCRMLHKGGFNFTKAFLDRDLLMHPGSIHCVNLAQGLKEPVIYWSVSGDGKCLDAIYKGMEDLRRFGTYPNGMFGGDEAYRGNNPVQGIELCSIVEMMYSYEEMFKVTGDPLFASNLERVAYNALPAHVTDDFREHQYFQQVNQVSVSRGPHNFDINYKGTQNLFGFLTGYPCCLCNQHQGWPKLTQNLWYRTSDGGFAAGVYAPCHFTAEVGGTEVTLTEKTEYPFVGEVSVNLSMSRTPAGCFSISFRIPDWAEGSVVKVNGRPIDGVIAGRMLRINRHWADGDNITLSFPMDVRVSRWFENSASVERGPLVYALKVDHSWEKVELDKSENKGPYYFKAEALSPWNYALLKDDLKNPSKAFTVNVDGSKFTGGWYWNENSSPVEISARGARFPDWTLYNGDTGTMPYSQLPSPSFNVNNATSSYLSDGTYDTLTLIPYGCTVLRITEFPVVNR